MSAMGIVLAFAVVAFFLVAFQWDDAPKNFWTFVGEHLEPLMTAAAFGAATFAGFLLFQQLGLQREELKELRQQVALDALERLYIREKDVERRQAATAEIERLLVYVEQLITDMVDDLARSVLREGVWAEINRLMSDDLGPLSRKHHRKFLALVRILAGIRHFRFVQQVAAPDDAERERLLKVVTGWQHIRADLDQMLADEIALIENRIRHFEQIIEG